MQKNERRFFALAERSLLIKLLSDWPRRGKRLLQIGDGECVGPSFFQKGGFDVTFLSRSGVPQTEERNAEAEYVTGAAEHLPFNNWEFEYAVLLYAEPTERAQGRLHVADPALVEAARVSKRGIVVLDWNKNAFSGIPRGDWRSRREEPNSQGIVPSEVERMLNVVAPERKVTVRSNLFLGPTTWEMPLLGSLNLMAMPFAFGSLIGFRMDWHAAPLSPIGIIKDAAARLFASRQSSVGLPS